MWVSGIAFLSRQPFLWRFASHSVTCKMYRDTVTNPRFISFCVISARYFRNKQFQGLNSKQDRQKSPTLPFRNLTLLTLRSKILKVAHITAVAPERAPVKKCAPSPNTSWSGLRWDFIKLISSICCLILWMHDFTFALACFLQWYWRFYSAQNLIKVDAFTCVSR